MATKIKSLNRHAVIMIAKDVERAIRDELDEYGLSVFRQGRITFDSGKMKIKFEISVPELKEVENENLAEGYGLPADIVGTKFNSRTPTGRARWFRVVEIVPRRHRYPITAQRIKDGKRFKFSVADVKYCLKMNR